MDPSPSTIILHLSAYDLDHIARPSVFRWSMQRLDRSTDGPSREPPPWSETAAIPMRGRRGLLLTPVMAPATVLPHGTQYREPGKLCCSAIETILKRLERTSANYLPACQQQPASLRLSCCAACSIPLYHSALRSFAVLVPALYLHLNPVKTLSGFPRYMKCP
nr:hypothetical protein CFP56_52197 [Quercus suber]